MELDFFTNLAGQIMEASGVAVITGGAALSVIFLLLRPKDDPYRRFRQNLGRAILLGLELLVAADIIRTVSRVPTLTQASVLAIIVLIRTTLSFTLQMELYHRWPWQKPEPKQEESKP